jgi:glycosyltransferase involved in cell wall biosynthesis
MRLVFITQKIDRDDPILGAADGWVAALAARCDEVVVMCLAVGPHDLPPHVSFRTFSAQTRLRRGARFAAALAPILLRQRADAILAHSVPIYVVLAAPLAKPLRVPLLLWYAHWAGGRALKLADRLCDAVLTVDAGSYPLASSKLRPIGHGIDVEEFAAFGSSAKRHRSDLRLLALGRTSPTKGFLLLLDGFARAVENGFDGTLELRGPSTTDAERRHRVELERRIAEPPLRGRVSLEPPVPRTEVPHLLRRFDAVVNTHEGTLDKVVYEAAACAVPVLACSPQWDGFLGDLPVKLSFRCEPDDLAGTLVALAAADREAFAAAGRELRRRVEQSHSVDTWAERVLAVVRELRQPS